VSAPAKAPVQQSVQPAAAKQAPASVQEKPESGSAFLQYFLDKADSEQKAKQSAAAGRAPYAKPPAAVPAAAPPAKSIRARVAYILFALLTAGMVVLAAVTSIYRKTPDVVTQPDIQVPSDAPDERVLIRQEDGLTILTIAGTDIILVNESHPLPETYGKGLDQEAAAAFAEMAAAAQADGILLFDVNDYRSYSSQKVLWERAVQFHGEEEAALLEEKAGCSEHQLGTAFDIAGEDASTMVQLSFRDTPEYDWLIANGARYGFILRYPENKTEVTGRPYTPWHFRYVGPAAAQVIWESGMVLEEFAAAAQPA